MKREMVTDFDMITFIHCYFVFSELTLLRNISSSYLTDMPALMLHTDCTVNESVRHTNVSDLFQLMELCGHKLLFWPCQVAAVHLVSQRLFITPQPVQVTMNLFPLVFLI